MSGSVNFRQFTTGPFAGGRVLNSGTADPLGAARGILLSCSADAKVTLTMNDNTSVVVFPQAGAAGTGDNVYPFSVSEYVVNSGTIVSAYNLY